jgi:maltose alpha-D-glucosyltransferase/alpha-amylase
MDTVAPDSKLVPRATTAPTGDPLWYKDAVIYQLHVKSFFDSNNDGIGDIPGLISKLDYIAQLGVTVIWLLPFYPSPRLDDGYDISEYRGVHPDYGTMADVKRFIHEAHKRNIRVIFELVINHTSDQHPWFQRARRAKPGSSHRNFYVWSDNDQKYVGTRIIFLDTERSNWTWDPVANAYYWHRFYSHQPDLNFDNPQVVKAVFSVMKFWLGLGVDGLRLDAVPYLVEREGTSNENLPETHAILKRLRAELDKHFPDRMLLAEANQWPEDVKDYFGDGDECHMAFHFPLMPRMYMAIAREDRFPITDILRQTPDIPPNCQWAIFLRNHDELTLEMVTDVERDYLWQTYASDKRARLNLGIRRRLTPLLERDRRRVELMTALLFSMPGTPVIYYGDEIGMGDNIYLGDRDGVRTPMQWSPDRNGGFSHADPASLVLPPNMDALYGFETVNVEAQSRDRHSLLNWMRVMLTVRKQHLAFGRGKFKLLYPKNRKILAYLREIDEETVLCCANLSRTPQAVELDLSEYQGRVPIELTGDSVFPPIGQLTYLLTLPPYGIYWFILAKEHEWPSWHTPAPEPMPEYETYVIRDKVAEALTGPARATFERETLPKYLAKRRWFAVKDRKIDEYRIALLAPVSAGKNEYLLAEIEVKSGRGATRWLLPLAPVWGVETAPLPQQLALANIRQGRRTGFLTDAFALASFARDIVAALRAKRVVPIDGSELRFEPTGELEQVAIAPDADVTWLSAEQSNSSLIVGDKAMLKMFRRILPGFHPEAEMSRYLTEHGFTNSPPLLGEILRIGADGTRHTLSVLQGFVRNQGDAWTWMLDELSHAIDDLRPERHEEHGQEEHLAPYEAFVATIGKRLAEMHAVLAQPSDDPAFAPGQADAAETESWVARAEQLLNAAFEAVAARAAWDSDADAAAAKALLSRQKPLLAAVKRLAQRARNVPIARIHGDFHLGQVLVANGDAYIIDFEGEPNRPVAERRAKASPLRDVAGMLRSFDYAAAMTERKGQASQAHVAEVARQRLVEEFRRRIPEAFLAAYDAIGGTRSAAQQAALDLFLIEKAAYEIGYEAANRPAWIRVPLIGLNALADGLLQEAKHG